MTRTLHVGVVGRPRRGGANIVAVLRWDQTGTRRVIVRRVPDGDPTSATYRAVLLGLREARRVGARVVVVYTDDARVAGQLGGREPLQTEVLSLYLQVRALLNAFRSAGVRYARSTPGASVIGAASEISGENQPMVFGLPLWTAAS